MDDLALKNAKTNIDINGVIVPLKQASIEDLTCTYDFIAANLTFSIFKKRIATIAEHLHKDGLCVLSGVLQEELKQLIDELKCCSFSIIEEMHEDIWSALVVRNEGS